tara:strand:- start:74 stop:784 length:711 start_codon:yes stop_codon:yes gene_type:complete
MTKVIVNIKNNIATFHFGGKPIHINKAYDLYKKGTKFGIPILTGNDALKVYSPKTPNFIPNELMSIVLSYIPFREDWIKAVVSHDIPNINKMIKTYPPEIINMEIPMNRFKNIINERKQYRDGMLFHIPKKNTLTALEYAQIVKFDLGEWYVSEDFWQMSQDMEQSVYDIKYKKPLEKILKKWEDLENTLLQSSKRKNKHIQRNRMIQRSIPSYNGERFSPTIITYKDLGYSNRTD